jgi:thiol-disulfide isomerase/thioredoxin
MKIFYQASLAGVLLLVLSVAVFFTFSPKTSSDTTASDSLQPGAAAAISQASFYDLHEKVQPLAQWQGKVMVVNFWATWCPPCIAEIPEFIKFQKQYAKQGVQFVGIAIDQKSKVQAFAEEKGMNYPVLLGDLAGIDLARRIGNKEGGLPYTVIVDRSGKIVTTQLGTLSREKLEEIVKPLL